MGAEIAAVPNISEGLAKISTKMMDLAAQLQALAAPSAEQAMSLGAAERSDRQAMTFLRPRQHEFKQRLRGANSRRRMSCLPQPKAAVPRGRLPGVMPLISAETRLGGVVLGMASTAPLLPKPPSTTTAKRHPSPCLQAPQPVGLSPVTAVRWSLPPSLLAALQQSEPLETTREKLRATDDTPSRAAVPTFVTPTLETRRRDQGRWRACPAGTRPRCSAWQCRRGYWRSQRRQRRRLRVPLPWRRSTVRASVRFPGDAIMRIGFHSGRRKFRRRLEQSHGKRSGFFGRQVWHDLLANRALRADGPARALDWLPRRRGDGADRSESERWLEKLAIRSQLAASLLSAWPREEKDRVSVFFQLGWLVWSGWFPRWPMNHRWFFLMFWAMNHASKLLLLPLLLGWARGFW
ncbi:hypothetical protein OsI_25746 [Oryza sativa Indica Group]|uniref:Uncharacterized protein n=1 Tax=Oryza sativa subsp. indica TaxID=39946 RepID=A2YKJ8_ORYSI|nr:hypothetical protein OsI_25746 [Oryza sativa Indica Group]